MNACSFGTTQNCLSVKSFIPVNEQKIKNKTFPHNGIINNDDLKNDTICSILIWFSSVVKHSRVYHVRPISETYACLLQCLQLALILCASPHSVKWQAFRNIFFFHQEHDKRFIGGVSSLSIWRYGKNMVTFGRIKIKFLSI